MVEEQKQEIIELKRVNAANKEIKAQMSKMMEEQEKTVDALKRELESIKSQQKVLKNEPQKAKASPKKKEDFTAIKIVEREEPTNPFEDDVNETQSTNPFEGGSNIVINGNNSHINEEKKAQQKRANPFVTQHEKPKELHIKKKASARPVTMMPGNFKPLRSASDVSPKPTVSSAGDVSGADVRWVKKIVVCADSAVRYIEFDFSDGAVVSQGTLLKGAMTYYLKDGQHVNAIYGRRTQVLERVLIKFNTGEPFGPFGTHDGPDTFAYYAEDNESMQDVRMDKKKSFWSNDPCTVVPVWRRYK